MKDKNQIELQKGLIKKMWHKGWMAFRAEAIGFINVEYSYIIGLKKGRIALLNVQQLKSGNSKKKVSDRADEMDKIVSLTGFNSYDSLDNITYGFAIARGWSDQWQYLDTDRVSVKYRDEMEELFGVIEP